LDCLNRAFAPEIDSYVGPFQQYSALFHFADGSQNHILLCVTKEPGVLMIGHTYGAFTDNTHRTVHLPKPVPATLAGIIDQLYRHP
jgi:hypothetical protein